MEVEQAVFIVARDKNQFIIKSWCFEWENVYNLLFFSTFPCGEGGVWLHDEYVTDFFFFFVLTSLAVQRKTKDVYA